MRSREDRVLRVKSMVLGALLAGGLAVLVTGCASFPVSKELKEEAQPVKLAAAQNDPGAYRGKVVVWGGRVIKTVNETNGGSIYILKLPLDRYNRPETGESVSGRFVASSKGFIEPEVFRKGRLVTVAGRLEGVEKEPLQKTEYSYPVVRIEELKMWHQEQNGYYYYYYPAWYWGWYRPGWYGSWGYGPGWYGPAWGMGWSGPDWDLDRD